MRLHRNLVFAVVDTLTAIFNGNKYADKAISKSLKKDKRWGARDRGFIAGTTYDMVRWKRLYAKIANVKEPFEPKDFFRMFTVWATLRGIALPDWDEFENTPTRRIKGGFDKLQNERKYAESIPDWMDELGVRELGEERWSREITELNKTAEVVLRANRWQNTPDQLIQQLDKEGIIANKLADYPDAVQLHKRADVFKTEAFKKGCFEVQDASSQLVAPLLDITPGLRVVDACAGAGGKTLHLASLMSNKGQIIALDIIGGKLKELKRRARRAQVHNIETRKIESTKTIKKLKNSADRLLIDAPCSGLGVLKRNPDAKWKMQPDFIDKIKQTQQELLQEYARMLKPGGKMVYATCSILPSENEAQIDAFLKSERGQDFKKEFDQTEYPSETGYDGFYRALLVKSNS